MPQAIQFKSHHPNPPIHVSQILILQEHAYNWYVLLHSCEILLYMCKNLYGENLVSRQSCQIFVAPKFPSIQYIWTAYSTVEQ